MDTSIANILVGFLLPLLLIVASVFWTMKVPYSKRFQPVIMLFLLAILTFLFPLLLASFDIIDGGFGIGLISVYFSVSLAFCAFVSFIVVFLVKNKIP